MLSRKFLRDAETPGWAASAISGTRKAAAIAAAVRPATVCSLTDDEAWTSNRPLALGSRAVEAMETVFNGLKKVVEPARGSLRLVVDGDGMTAMAIADVDAILSGCGFWSACAEDLQDCVNVLILKEEVQVDKVIEEIGELNG